MNSKAHIVLEVGSTGGSYRGGGNFNHDFYSFERAEDIFKNFFGGRDPFANFFDDEEDDFFSFGFSGMGPKKNSSNAGRGNQR